MLKNNHLAVGMFFLKRAKLCRNSSLSRTGRISWRWQLIFLSQKATLIVVHGKLSHKCCPWETLYLWLRSSNRQMGKPNCPWETLPQLLSLGNSPSVTLKFRRFIRDRWVSQILHGKLPSCVTFFFYFYILQLYLPNGISYMGNSGCLSWGSQLRQSRYPTYGACWVF